MSTWKEATRGMQSDLLGLIRANANVRQDSATYGAIATEIVQVMSAPEWLAVDPLQRAAFLMSSPALDALAEPFDAFSMIALRKNEKGPVQVAPRTTRDCILLSLTMRLHTERDRFASVLADVLSLYAMRETTTREAKDPLVAMMLRTTPETTNALLVIADKRRSIDIPYRCCIGVAEKHPEHLPALLPRIKPAAKEKLIYSSVMAKKDEALRSLLAAGVRWTTATFREHRNHDMRAGDAGAGETGAGETGAGGQDARALTCTGARVVAARTEAEIETLIFEIIGV